MGPVATIAVIDDEESVRRSLARLLRAHGHAVQTFASVDEFLEGLRVAPRPSCLLVDLRMPGRTGLDLVQILNASGAPIPTIMITGHGERPVAERARQAGVVAVLSKPVDGDALLGAIAKVLRVPSDPPGD
jgi:two-component system, LuxR family, response regulator FixJ